MVSEPVETVVRDRGTGDGAEKGGGHHADLGRTACIAAGEDHRIVDEELAEPHALGDHAEQHEMEDDGRDDPERDAENAFLGEVHIVDELAPVDARMFQDLDGDIGAEQRIGDEHQNDAGKDRTERAPGDLQNQHHEDGAEDDVRGNRCALTKRLFGNAVGKSQKIDVQPEPGIAEIER